MFRVYITGRDNLPYSFDYDDLSEALKATAKFRNEGYEFVTIVSENPNCTSKVGVDEVKDVENYDGWISRSKAS